MKRSVLWASLVAIGMLASVEAVSACHVPWCVPVRFFPVRCVPIGCVPVRYVAACSAPVYTVPACAAPVCHGGATISVHIPADARLYIDGNGTASGGATRQFETPPLESGREFTYNLRAERSVNGKLVAETRTIKVRSNETTVVHFGDTPSEPATAVAQSSTVQVRALPGLLGAVRETLKIRPVEATAAEVSVSTKAPAAGAAVQTNAGDSRAGTVRVRIRQRPGVALPRVLRLEASIGR